MNLATGTSRAGTPTGQRAKILYAKSRVTLHPTPYARDNKPGFLALLLREQNPRKALSRVKRPDSGHEGSASLMPVAGQSTSLAQCQASQIVLAWLSENIVKQRGETAKFIEMELREAEGLHANKEVACVGAADSLSLNAETSDSVYIEMPPESFADRKASDPQDVFSQSLGSIHSVQVVPPTVSNWHGSLVITLVGGQLLPPLYFHDDESSSTLLGMHRASMSALPQSSHWPPPVSSAIREGSSSASAAASSTTIGSNSLTPIWGGDELVQHLRKYSFVHRSVHDHRVFLINPQSEDLEAHSTPIFSDDALDPPQRSNELKSANFAFPDDPFSPTYPLGRLASSSLDQPTEGGDLDSLSSWAKSTRMSLLSQFSHVTRSARDASRQLMEHPIVASAQQRYQRRLAEKVPTAAQSYANAGPLGPFRTDPLSSTVQGVEDMAEKAGVSEYDSARVYLAKWARSVAEEGERNKRLEEKGKNKATAASHGGTRFEKSGLGVFEVLEHPDASSRALRTFRPIKVAEWVSWAADGSDGGPTLPLAEVKELVFTRGLAAKSRSSAWPVLLGVEVWQASHQQRQQHKLQRRQAWLRLKSTWDVGAADVRPTDSIDDSEKCGQLYIMASHLMEREDIQEQRHRIRVDCLRTDRKMPYFSNRSYFGTEARTPSLVDTAFKVDDCDTGHSESGNPHMAVLAEILLTYSIYDVLFFSESALISQQSSICAEIPPLQLARMASGKSVRDSDLGGYVQGMSDLCSVLYVACEADASETFWCFVALMQRMRSNFLSSQSGMKSQLLHLQSLVRLCDRGLYDHLDQTGSLNLFFCFRWLLVRFKREFDLEGVERIWECGWALEPEPERLDVNVGPDTALRNSQVLELATASAKIPNIKGTDGAQSTTAIDSPKDESRRSPDDSLKFSSASFSLPHTAHFHLFLCLALLTSHRSVVIDHLRTFDEVLQYFQGLGLGTNSNSSAALRAASVGTPADSANVALAANDVETSIRHAAILLCAVADKIKMRRSKGFATGELNPDGNDVSSGEIEGSGISANFEEVASLVSA